MTIISYHQMNVERRDDHHAKDAHLSNIDYSSGFRDVIHP